MTLPDFYLIGCMKCGTTTVRRTLMEHPQINMFDGELVFHHPTKKSKLTLQQYESLFVADMVNGDHSTDYSKRKDGHDFECINSIREHSPNAKIIYGIRNPIDRVLSQFNHDYPNYTRSLEDFCKDPIRIAIGRYWMQIQPYVEYFGKENIFVYKLEDLSQEIMNEMFKFLGLETFPTTIKKFNKRKYHKTKDLLSAEPIKSYLDETLDDYIKICQEFCL